MPTTAQTEPLKTITDNSAAPCGCWLRFDDALREKGYCIAKRCASLKLSADLSQLSAAYHLPIERVDRKPLKASEPKTLEISHCPFCGKKL